MQCRVKKLLKRAYSREFQYTAEHLDLLPRPLQACARRLVLEGRDLRSTARLTHLTLHAVRQRQTRVNAILEAQTQFRPPRPHSAARPPALPAAVFKAR